MEGFQVEQEAIEAERGKAYRLRKQHDDPEAKAAFEWYDAIKAELGKLEITDRLREEPAFQAQIEDCQTVIDQFSGKPSTATLSNQKPLTEKTDVVGVPKLDIRKVEAGPEEGVVVRKKKA